MRAGVSAPLLAFFTPLQQIQVHYRWCFGLLAKKESQERLSFLQPWCGSPCKWLITCLDCHLNNTSVLFCAWHLNSVMFSGRRGLFVLNFCKWLRRSTEMRVALWNVVFVETERKIGGGRECPHHLSLEMYSPAQPALPPLPVFGTALLYTTTNKHAV